MRAAKPKAQAKAFAPNQSSGLTEQEAEMLGTTQQTSTGAARPCHLLMRGPDMRRHSRAFTAAYVLIAFTLVSAMTVLAATSVASGSLPRPVTALPLISNRSSPAAMDKHFNQHPRGTFPASSLGLPDGTCYVYGNKVSWIVLQCFGAQPEVKP